MTNAKKAKTQAEAKGKVKTSGKVPEKYFVVDTSALEYSMDVFEKLRQNGRNCVNTLPA